jgi:hypothetical protein
VRANVKDEQKQGRRGGKQGEYNHHQDQDEATEAGRGQEPGDEDGKRGRCEQAPALSRPSG